MTNKMLYDAVDFPNINGCPECDSKHLSGVEVMVQEADIRVNSNGNIRNVEEDTLIGAYYSEIFCFECGTMLVEDGEIVHGDVEAYDSE